MAFQLRGVGSLPSSRNTDARWRSSSGARQRRSAQSAGSRHVSPDQAFSAAHPASGGSPLRAACCWTPWRRALGDRERGVTVGARCRDRESPHACDVTLFTARKRRAARCATEWRVLLIRLRPDGRPRDEQPHDCRTLVPSAARSSSSCSNASPNPPVLPEAIARSRASLEG